MTRHRNKCFSSSTTCHDKHVIMKCPMTICIDYIRFKIEIKTKWPQFLGFATWIFEVFPGSSVSTKGFQTPHFSRTAYNDDSNKSFPACCLPGGRFVTVREPLFPSHLRFLSSSSYVCSCQRLHNTQALERSEIAWNSSSKMHPRTHWMPFLEVVCWILLNETKWEALHLYCTLYINCISV